MSDRSLHGHKILIGVVILVGVLVAVALAFGKSNPEVADNPAGVLNGPVPSEIYPTTTKLPETTTSLPPVTAPETSVPVRPQQADRPTPTEPSRSAPITLEEPQVDPPGGSDDPGRVVHSTAYCLTGHMADGQETHDGAVAMNGVPLGSQWKVIETGAVYTVEDRIGSGSDFDIWMSSCAAANSYGRQTVHVVEV